MKALSYFGLGTAAGLGLVLIHLTVRLIAAYPHQPALVISLFVLSVGLTGFTVYSTRSPRWLQYAFIITGVSGLIAWA